MKRSIILAVIGCYASCAVLSACNQSEDKVQTVEKDGAVEVSLKVGKGPRFDTLMLSYKVFKDGLLRKENVVVDSLPSLGTTVEDGEDKDGNEASLPIPKNYNLFVTVK
jgi:hypothetical protein